MQKQSTPYRRPAAGWRVGFEVSAPPQIALTPGKDVVRLREVRDGQPVGELEIATFDAALVIDRDGVLADIAKRLVKSPAAVPVALPGASGFRAEVRGDAALPYVYAFAVAPHDHAIGGGVTVVLRCASPDWPAAEEVLRSLRILTRNGAAPANDCDPSPRLG